ncbi:hypothetical protein B0A69_19725 [Chryseobacterium shigense]|uniref:Uncharacterized protein n=1 Tax=Chryseobacterium shigense TaxID=297244 RepID=A0A1N7HZL6_9FLAO|nr:hypothetical protein [Chryseobacterium shigense]PQA90963.1 hypothetical protein B0A69_19725 [Chryseobacterium shigense]SIS30285.1 hypothetical protein SAMN05421639_101814 [Chryseobacterium shigense]
MRIKIQNSTSKHILSFDDEKEFKNFQLMITAALLDKENTHTVVFNKDEKIKIFPSLLLKNSIIEFIGVDDNDDIPEAEWN